ncbi:Lipid-A-disaccharide synthase [Candidatus Providencia siddallii]|uniref:Lipid-A-disaccharide synthase n=1 Tax=Candidatus Providencia siddallii TaxID=1715285 RepID=A0A0M6W8S4_9GAMM|nr:Lipid-A-disaccharide synthase [Candidatus Providencia siddallii]
MNNKQQSLVIGIVSGEISGDILGANLIRKFKEKVPNTRFIGVPGPLMRTEGCEVLYKMEEFAVIGFNDILKKIFKFLLIRKKLIKYFNKFKIDLFIGIDAPDFNLNLEKHLKSKGIKTIHYVSPSIWAWRKKRIIKIKKSTNLILVLLPFEKAIYDKFNIKCCFIGHSAADEIPLKPNRDEARIKLNIPKNVKCLAILPGSRYSEIEMLSGIFLKTAKILQKQFTDLHIIVPLANKLCRQKFEDIKKTILIDAPILFLDGQARDAMTAANVTLLTSGTASLECMLTKCPMIVAYKMKLFWIAKILVKTPYISLPNILAQKEIVKEFLQKKCQPDKIAQQLIPLFNEDKNIFKLKQTFLKLHNLIRCDSDNKAVNAILKLIKN